MFYDLSDCCLRNAMSTAQNTQHLSAHYWKDARNHQENKRDISNEIFADSTNNNHKYAWGTAQHPRIIHTQHYCVPYCFVLSVQHRCFVTQIS
jgi:hypothetical protein